MSSDIGIKSTSKLNTFMKKATKKAMSNASTYLPQTQLEKCQELISQSVPKENPTTGKKQYVSLSPDEEIKLGLESAPKLISKMGGEVPDSDPRTQEVQAIGQYLLNHSVAKNGPWQFKFHLLADNETINAFALPGGQIFITIGLYNKLKDEAQLAYVLGHEMGHVIERHRSQKIAKGKLGNILIDAVATTSNDSENSNYSPAVIVSFVNQMIQLSYSRKHESQSDIWGVNMMISAGFDPKAMIEVIQILKEIGSSVTTSNIFQMHPNPDLRIEKIQEYLERNPPPTGLSKGRLLSH